jgi:hypothetical protein
MVGPAGVLHGVKSLRPEDEFHSALEMALLSSSLSRDVEY